MSGAGSFRSWLARVEAVNPRNWLIGPIVALLGWQVGFETPVSGLDQSWWAGLYMAAHDGKQFGTELDLWAVRESYRRNRSSQFRRATRTQAVWNCTAMVTFALQRNRLCFQSHVEGGEFPWSMAGQFIYRVFLASQGRYHSSSPAREFAQIVHTRLAWPGKL